MGLQTIHETEGLEESRIWPAAREPNEQLVRAQQTADGRKTTDKADRQEEEHRRADEVLENKEKHEEHPIEGVRLNQEEIL